MKVIRNGWVPVRKYYPEKIIDEWFLYKDDNIIAAIKYKFSIEGASLARYVRLYKKGRKALN